MSTEHLSQIKARHNGIVSEYYARLLYDIETSTKALIDGEYAGHLVEVKSCQVQITDLSRRGGLRKGRFLIQRLQHCTLYRNDGYYCFIVLDGKGKILLSRLVPSQCLEGLVPLKDHGTTQIAWNKIFPGALFQ